MKFSTVLTTTLLFCIYNIISAQSILFKYGTQNTWEFEQHRFYPLNTGSSILIGRNAGNAEDYSNNFNIYIGQDAARSNEIGALNVALGSFTAYNQQYGDRNTFLGAYAAHNAYYPSRSVFIGFEAGYSEIFNDRLHINNSKDRYPLIYGEFDNQKLRIGGNLEIRGKSLDDDKVISMGNEEGNYHRVLVRQPDNDIYFGDVDPTNAEVHIRANGENWLSILPTGNVGYGISNPDNPFHIHKRTFFDRAPLKITDHETGSNVADGFDIGFLPTLGDLDLTLKYREVGTMRFIPKSGFGLAIDESGRVGIGTRDPQVDLHVTNSVGGASKLLISEDPTPNNDGLMLNANTDGSVSIDQRAENESFDLQVKGQTKMSILKGGIAVGTSTLPNQEMFRINAPGYLPGLTVAFDGNDRFMCTDDRTIMFGEAAIRQSTQPTLLFDRSSSGSWDGTISLTSGGDFIFRGGDDIESFTPQLNDLMVIESNGEIGIGTISPSDQLHVNATAGSNAFRVQTDGNTRMRIYSNGGISLGSNNAPSPGDVFVTNQLGLGITNPTYRIHLSNSSTASEGYGLAKGWSTYSDDRVKFGKQKLKYGLAEILEMKPMSYQHANSNFEHGNLVLDKNEVHFDIGLIAQQLHALVPEVVKKPENEQEELWSIEYAKLVPVLIQAIQDQQALIEQQNKRISNLENRISN